MSNHSQGIYPTGPMCSGSNTNCTNQSQTARYDKVDNTCAAADACGVPKISWKHAQTFSSCRLAKSSVSSGLTARNQKFALVAPHMDKRRNADWVSLTQGIRWKSTCYCLDLCARNSCTYSCFPMGMPKTFTPCWATGKRGSPRQTTASGFNALTTWSSPRSHWVGRHLYSTLGSKNAITRFPGLMFSWMASRVGRHLTIQLHPMVECDSVRTPGVPCVAPQTPLVPFTPVRVKVAGVAVHSIQVATTAQVVRTQEFGAKGFPLESAAARVCREAGGESDNERLSRGFGLASKSRSRQSPFKWWQMGSLCSMALACDRHHNGASVRMDGSARRQCNTGQPWPKPVFEKSAPTPNSFTLTVGRAWWWWCLAKSAAGGLVGKR